MAGNGDWRNEKRDRPGSAPVVLELASLPREQMGPFLLLGLDKAAPAPTVERNWADRLKWARRNLVKVPLEDINWARETLNDPERRIKFDAGSLNLDSTDQTLHELARRYGLSGGKVARQWQALDVEKALEGYTPTVEIPAQAGVANQIAAIEVPEEMPAARALLEDLARQVIDPWAGDLLPRSPAGEIA